MKWWHPSNRTPTHIHTKVRRGRTPNGTNTGSSQHGLHRVHTVGQITCSREGRESLELTESEQQISRSFPREPKVSEKQKFQPITQCTSRTHFLPLNQNNPCGLHPPSLLFSLTPLTPFSPSSVLSFSCPGAFAQAVVVQHSNALKSSVLSTHLPSALKSHGTSQGGLL